MPGWIEKDPERRPGLVWVFGCAESQHGRFAGIQVVDDHVEVHLLRCILTGPIGSRESLDLLETDALAVFRPDLRPVVGSGDIPVEHLPVEAGEFGWIGTVDDKAGERCDSHALRVPSVGLNELSSPGSSTRGERPNRPLSRPPRSWEGRDGYEALSKLKREGRVVQFSADDSFDAIVGTDAVSMTGEAGDHAPCNDSPLPKSANHLLAPVVQSGADTSALIVRMDACRFDP